MPLNIYERINEIRKIANYAQKDRTVSTGGEGSYKAVSHDAITALLRNHLIAHQIIVAPAVVESTVVEAKTKSGTPLVRYQGRFEVAFICADRPEDRTVLPVEAHGQDTGDKAPGKALSIATKNAMLKLFTIETGENEEARAESFEEFEVVTREQITAIGALVDERVNDHAKFAQWLLKAAGTEFVDQLPQRKFDMVVNQLKSMPKRSEKKRGAAKKDGDAKPDESGALPLDAPADAQA